MLVQQNEGYAQTDSTSSEGFLKKKEIVYQRLDSLQEVAHQKAMRNSHARRVDSLFNVRDKRSRDKYDTLFIYKPHERWTFRWRGNLSGNEIVMRGRNEGIAFRNDLHAAHKLTFTLGVGFRGLNFSLAANPLKWAGKNKDFEYNLNSYSNRYGFDVIYTTANTFRGTIREGDDSYSVKAGEVRQKLLTINGYYAFNYRRFSFPAAFSQSQIQLRSAGSWLLSCMFLGGSLRNESEERAFPRSVLHSYSFGIGGGYAYNFVFPRSWLLHVSATPEIVVYNHSNLEIEGSKAKMPYKFPNFMTVARIAVVHNWDHCFCALSSVFNYGDTGDYDNLRIFQFKWRVRLAFGFRI